MVKNIRLTWSGLQENSPEFDNNESFVQYFESTATFLFINGIFIHKRVLALITMVKSSIIK